MRGGANNNSGRYPANSSSSAPNGYYSTQNYSPYNTNPNSKNMNTGISGASNSSRGGHNYNSRGGGGYYGSPGGGYSSRGGYNSHTNRSYYNNVNGGYNKTSSSAGSTTEANNNETANWNTGYKEFVAGPGATPVRGMSGSPRFIVGRGRGGSNIRGSSSGRNGPKSNYYGSRGSHDSSSYGGGYDSTSNYGHYYENHEDYGKYGSSGSTGEYPSESSEQYDYYGRRVNNNAEAHTKPGSKESGISLQHKKSSGDYHDSERLEREKLKEIEDEKMKELKKKKELEREKEFSEKHWISRIHARGELKNELVKNFDALDVVNSRLLDIERRRNEIQMDVDRYNRLLKAEDERVRLNEEALEAMEFM